MQKSFSVFLQQLHLNHDSIKESEILELITQDEFEGLKCSELLKGSNDLTHIMCESCDESHFLAIQCSKGKPYVVCISDSKPNYLEPFIIRRWEFDTCIFLRLMANKLDISEEVEALKANSFWQIGKLKKDDIWHFCFFYHGKKIEDVAQFLASQERDCERFIVITSKKESFAETQKSNIMLIEASLLVELKKKDLKFNKKVFQQYLSAFREVQFDLESGHLRVSGELIVTIPLNTTQYHFAAYLWEHFDQPIANSQIKDYISKKKKYPYQGSDQFCYDLKDKIKVIAKGHKRKRDLLHSIFVTSPTTDNQNGFMMQNPN